MRRRATALVTAAAGALALAGAALAGNGGILPPAPHSPNAHRITDAYLFVLGFTGAIFLIVEGAVITFAIRYRRGRRARTVEGPQIHGATRLEIIWTVVPVLILAAIGTFVFWKLPGISGPPAASAAEETTITIEGRQFYWLFHYPNGAVSVGTMVAPADQVVHETVVSADDDVNHSWWVPNLGGKIDAIPGKANHTWFMGDPGTYRARCAELCGIQHAIMEARVRLVPRAEYDRFIAERKADAAGATLGKEEWDNVCTACHRLDHVYVGPALGGNPLLRDRKGIEAILRRGVGKMPAVGSDWSDQQIDALIAYTKTLKRPRGG
ncbi:MAG TPA: cytochrome c oxidase subunit II [Gaiellaceae bacterium]|nr:cytochrome c oxidase subunit II [Gaiellaceae bacterium]